MQRAILSLLFLRQCRPLRYHTLSLESAIFLLLLCFVGVDISFAPEFFPFSARHWYLTPQLGLRFSSKWDSIGKALTHISRFFIATLRSNLVVCTPLSHKWVIPLRFKLLRRLLEICIRLVSVLHQIFSISFNIDLSRPKFKSLLALTVVAIFLLAIWLTPNAREVLVLYDHCWVSNRCL